MSNRIYADMLEQFLDMEDSDLLDQLGVAVRNWKDFPHADSLRLAYDQLNSGKSRYARNVVKGVITEILLNLPEWTAEEILKREG